MNLPDINVTVGLLIPRLWQRSLLVAQVQMEVVQKMAKRRRRQQHGS
jgi:hypothetical protein